jgi:hypothetical protein
MICNERVRLIIPLLLGFMLAMCGYASAERVELRCNDAILDYDKSMMVTISSDDGTGLCYFEVSLPPDLSSSNRPNQPAAWLQRAYDAPPDDRTEIISKFFAPQLANSWKSVLNSKDIGAAGGFEFAKILAEQSALIEKCTQTALEGDPFDIVDANLSLSCNLVEAERVYVVTASMNGVSVQSRIPLA